MGRDDARAVPGLAGGRAPARAFASYMARAVGGTPPAPLVTDMPSGELIIEPDDQVYGIDQGGEPAAETEGEIRTPANVQAPVAVDNGPALSQAWLDKALNDGQQK
jgi:penicillin-binding protein 1A